MILNSCDYFNISLEYKIKYGDLPNIVYNFIACVHEHKNDIFIC